MRILHVAESIKGGVGSYLANLAPFQSSSVGLDNLRFIVPREHQAQLTGVDSSQIRTYARPDRSANSFRSLASALKAQVRAFNPHVVHVHSTFAGLIARPMIRRQPLGPLIIYCPHGWAFNVQAAFWKRAALEGVERVLAPFADAVIAISSYEEAEGKRIGISPAKIHLVPNGVSELEPTPAIDPSWNDGRLKVLFVGRLDRQKGVDLLLKAVQTLTSQVSVRIVGEAVASDQRLDFPSNVSSLGWLAPKAIGSQLATCDVVVVPSRWEGFGLVAVEAMRAGKPVIATRVGGLPEVLGHGLCGLLIEPESPSAIRAGLLALDKCALVAMGARGRQRYLANFTAERMSRDLLELYARVSEGRSTAKPVPQPQFAKTGAIYAAHPHRPTATTSPMAHVGVGAVLLSDEAQ